MIKLIGLLDCLKASRKDALALPLRKSCIERTLFALGKIRGTVFSVVAANSKASGNPGSEMGRRSRTFPNPVRAGMARRTVPPSSSKFKPRTAQYPALPTTQIIPHAVMHVLTNPIFKTRKFDLQVPVIREKSDG